MYISDANNVVIEITRRCNMCCAHCLRGDAENVDIQEKYINALAVVEELTEEYMRKYNSPNTQEIMFRLLVELAKQYKTVRLVLNINGKTTEVKYPVKGMMNSDILYGGGFSTCNITPRSEENRIEEFIANNDSQLEDNRRIPIKYIPEVYYGNKLIWKNPNFANT